MKALPLSTVERFVPIAAQKGVSEVARSPRGFLQAFRRAGGSLPRLSPEWRAKREAFIKRHMAQVAMRGEALFDASGLPSRRHLALIMWAYSPRASKLPRSNPDEPESRVRQSAKVPPERRHWYPAEVPAAMAEVYKLAPDAFSRLRPEEAAAHQWARGRMLSRNIVVPNTRAWSADDEERVLDILATWEEYGPGLDGAFEALQLFPVLVAAKPARGHLGGHTGSVGRGAFTLIDGFHRLSAWERLGGVQTPLPVVVGTPVPVRRRNPIPERDPEFLLDPLPWVGGTVLEDYCPEDDAGFFHVTTRGAKVFEEGRLRSRKDVGVVGLGGGHTDPGNHVSVVVNYQRAVWLYGAIKGLREAVDASAAAVVRCVLDWTGFPNGIGWAAAFDDVDLGASVFEDLAQFVFEMSSGRPDDFISAYDLASRRGWEELLQAAPGLFEMFEMYAPSPTSRYRLAQFMETRLSSTFSDFFTDDDVVRDTVGFTALPQDFLQIQPDDVTIVQLAVYSGAPEDMIPSECELRFEPRDVQIVAVGCENEARRIPVERAS